MAPQTSLVVSGLLAVVLVACGATAPEPTATATAFETPTPRSPTEPPTSTLAPVWTPATPASSSTGGACTDPYPGGAPFETEPGDPIRVRPAGSPPALEGYEPEPFVPDADLEGVVRESLGDDEARFAVIVKNLADGKGVRLAPARAFYAASLFKTWTMLEAFNQREAGLLDFFDRYVVTEHYAAFGLNPGELAACDEVSVDDLLRRSMAASDNVAANLLLDVVGAGNVNAALLSLGLHVSGFPTDLSLPTTAADMALLLEAIARGEAVNSAASGEMLALLESEAVGGRLPALLPPGTRVAHKTGSWPTATHDAGIVFSPKAAYVIVVLTDFGYQDDGGTAIATLSKAVYDYYNGG